jgi:hypothetical protein
MIVWLHGKLAALDNFSLAVAHGKSCGAFEAIVCIESVLIFLYMSACSR